MSEKTSAVQDSLKIDANNLLGCSLALIHAIILLMIYVNKFALNHVVLLKTKAKIHLKSRYRQKIRIPTQL